MRAATQVTAHRERDWRLRAAMLCTRLRLRIVLVGLPVCVLLIKIVRSVTG